MVRRALVSYYALNQPLIGDQAPYVDQTIAQYRVETWYGEFRIGRDFGDRFRLSFAALRGQDHAELKVGLSDVFPPSVVADVGGFNATLLWDSLDNVRFPRHGMRAEVSYTSYDQHMGSDDDGNLLRVSIDKAFTSGRNTLMLGARASLAKDAIDAQQSSSTLGGLTYLSGLRDRQLLGDQMLLLRSIYYRRLTQQSLLFDMPLYLAGSLEGGNVWDEYDDVALDDLIGAASVFLGIDLPIGPLQFGYGRTFDVAMPSTSPLVHWCCRLSLNRVVLFCHVCQSFGCFACCFHLIRIAFGWRERMNAGCANRRHQDFRAWITDAAAQQNDHDTHTQISH